MYRIVNSLANAEYDQELEAIVINFNGYGELSLYHETMDIAMNIAAVYRTNKWLFVKDFFQDINPYEFFFFIKKWSNTCKSMLSTITPPTVCQVVVLTSPATERKLMANDEWLDKSSFTFENLNLKIFTQEDEAYSFLSQQQNRNGEPAWEKINALSAGNDH